jgi:adenosylmethionine-8-amino-7-oxononanoate aminotransferase
MITARVTAGETSTFPRFLELAYPNIERGDGVWLFTTKGEEILDACSGGAMVASLGHGRSNVVDAGLRQAEKIAYFYMDHFTNEPMERLAERMIATTAPEMARVRFTSSGSEANETALRLARAYHVDRGEADRWRVISPAQAYHGSTMATLALSGRRRSLQFPYEPYLSPHLHIEIDPTGEAALRELDARIEEAGPSAVAAFYCEPISGAARPAFTPPDKFWRGLEERRARYGFLVCFDEVVTGMGRTGTWFAYQQLPIEPDIVTVGKGLGAGYAPISAVLCKQHVYDAVDHGSRFFDLGHTWDGAPISCATGLAVLDALVSRKLLERVRERGPRLLAQLQSVLKENPIVAEVRGRGFLLGVDLVDLADELHADELVEEAALEQGLLIATTHSTPDGYAGDQVVFAPAFTSTDDELAMMVQRLAAALSAVAGTVMHG